MKDYSEIYIDNQVKRFYHLGAAQEFVSELKRDNISFVWKFNGKVQI